MTIEYRMHGKLPLPSLTTRVVGSTMAATRAASDADDQAKAQTLHGDAMESILDRLDEIERRLNEMGKPDAGG